MNALDAHWAASPLRHSTADSLAHMDRDQDLALGDPVFPEAELRAVLRDKGPLEAWRRRVELKGALAADGVSGHFAVALRTSRGECFLAVDRFATHSLCWTLKGEQLHFAMRADVLARWRQDGAADLASQVDAQALFDYLFHHVIPSPSTVFTEVKRLPAAHALWHVPGLSPRLHRHWQARFEPQARPRFAPMAEEFRTLIEQAVRERIPQGAQPVCFLSGGTDSSTVVGMAAKVSGQRPLSYSIGFDSEGYDEMAYARIAAKAFSAEHREYYISAADLVCGIPKVASHYDQPFGNSSSLPAFYCARLAKLEGASHILAGDGGDELFGGNTRYAKERVFGLWSRLPPGLRQHVLGPMLNNGLTRAVPLARKGASYVRQAEVPMPDRMQSYNLLTRLGLDEVLSPAFLSRVQTGRPLEKQREVWAELGSGLTLTDHMLAFDWRYTLAENDLPKVVGTTELAGLPVGFPLLDDRLLDFSLKLPQHYKLRGLKLRWFFKEALKGFLPDEIITKKKHGFGLPFGPWTLRHDELNALASESLNALAGRGLVREAFVRDLMRHRLQEHPGYYGEMVWILMMLEQWLRHHAPSWRID